MKAKSNLHKRFFPQLRGKWGTLNLNELALDLAPLLGCFQQMPQEENPFLDPYYCQRWLSFIHKTKGVDYSWGGYLEDRSVIWRGHYHEKDAMTHLGVDIYVPVDTKVYLPVPGRLVHGQIDEDTHGGWGGKLIFKYSKGYFILGHLKKIPTVLSKFSEGAFVGVVAESAVNGGWSPHLHVQCMTEFNKDVDGYGKMYDGIEKDFPDPLVCL